MSAVGLAGVRTGVPYPVLARASFGTFFLLKLFSCFYQFVVISQTIRLAADVRFIDEANAENLQLTADLTALFFLIL